MANAPKPNVVWAGQSGFGLFGQSVTIGHYSLGTDVPEGGGLDAGSDPIGLAMAGLGGRISMTSRKVVARRKIHLVRGAPPARATTMDPAMSAVKSHIINRIATLVGDRMPENRALRIAMIDKCLLHTRPEGEGGHPNPHGGGLRAAEGRQATSAPVPWQGDEWSR